jgi:hypothetical protein
MPLGFDEEDERRRKEIELFESIKLGEGLDETNLLNQIKEIEGHIDRQIAEEELKEADAQENENLTIVGTPGVSKKMLRESVKQLTGEDIDPEENPEAFKILQGATKDIAGIKKKKIAPELSARMQKSRMREAMDQMTDVSSENMGLPPKPPVTIRSVSGGTRAGRTGIGRFYPSIPRKKASFKQILNNRLEELADTKSRLEKQFRDISPIPGAAPDTPEEAAEREAVQKNLTLLINDINDQEERILGMQGGLATAKPEKTIEQIEAEAAARARGTASEKPPDKTIEQIEKEATARARGAAKGTPGKPEVTPSKAMDSIAQAEMAIERLKRGDATATQIAQIQDPEMRSLLTMMSKGEVDPVAVDLAVKAQEAKIRYLRQFTRRKQPTEEEARRFLAEARRMLPEGSKKEHNLLAERLSYY